MSRNHGRRPMKTRAIVFSVIMILVSVAGCTGGQDEVSLNEQIDDLEGELSNLTALNEDLQNAINQANSNASDLSAVLDGANSELELLREAIEGLNSEKAALFNQSMALNMSIHDLMTQLISSENNTTGLMEVLEANEAELEGLNSEIAVLNSEITEALAEVSSLEETISALQGALGNIVTEVIPKISSCPLDNPGTELLIGIDDGSGIGEPDDGRLRGREVLTRFGGCPGNQGMVADLDAGSESTVSNIASMGGNLYFVADDGVHGRELWKSDGTVGGTEMLKDVCEDCPFFLESDIGQIFASDNKIFFVATTMDEGRELWVSDGTEQGTNMVIDLFQIPNQYYDVTISYDGPEIFFAITKDQNPSFADFVVFSAFKGSAPQNTVLGEELWISDGTASGTYMISDVNPQTISIQTDTGPICCYDSVGGKPMEPVMMGDEIFFTAENKVANLGRELYKTNLITSESTIVRDIRFGELSSDVTGLRVFDNRVYFSADSGTTGAELWATNGSFNGTVLVADIATEGSSSPRNLTVFDGLMYFSASEDGSGRELWVTNGSYWGTGLVSDIRPGTFGSNPRDLTVAGGTLFFTALINETGRELWSLQATGIEPQLLRDIRVGTETSGASHLLSHTGNLYFVADDGANGTEVWRSSGSQDSTELAFDINPTGSSHPREFTVLGEKIYVLADDGSRGVEIWFLAENEDIHLASD